MNNIFTTFDIRTGTVPAKMLVKCEGFDDNVNPLHYALLKWAVISYLITKYYPGSIEDGSANTCALCEAHKFCQECPIAIISDTYGCNNTPYHAYREARIPFNALIAAGNFYSFIWELLTDIKDYEVFVTKLSADDQYAICMAEQFRKAHSGSIPNQGE